MKSVDLSNLGGYPWTDNDFSYLQNAWTEGVQALAAIGASPTANVATVLYGMKSTAGGGGSTNVSAGWVVYNGVIIRFPAQSYGALAGGHAAYVVVTPTSVPHALPFADGSTPDVINDVTGVLTDLVSSTATDGTHFKLSDVVAWLALDATLYSRMTAAEAILNAWNSGWVDQLAAPTMVVTGGGTFAGGTCAYNKLKYLDNATVAWQFQLRGYTVTGTVNTIVVHPPDVFYMGGGGWSNPGQIFTGTVHFGAALYTVRGVLNNPGGAPVLTLTFEYAVFPPGGNANIDFALVAEVS